MSDKQMSIEEEIGIQGPVCWCGRATVGEASSVVSGRWTSRITHGADGCNRSEDQGGGVGGFVFRLAKLDVERAKREFDTAYALLWLAKGRV